MIEMKHVSQAYQKKKILDYADLLVNQYECCALVGRNGAGKSTLIHTLLGLLPLKNGTVTLHGHSNKKQAWKKSVSYLPEKFLLYQHLTGEENMYFFAALASKKVDQQKISEKLRLVSMWEDRNKLISSYSKGMLQRLGLAIMLYFDSEIIILDEPTSGLDPFGRLELLHIIKSLTDKTILMASHHFEEIQQVCSHVAYLENGKVTKYTVDEFLQSHLMEKLTMLGDYGE